MPPRQRDKISAETEKIEMRVLAHTHIRTSLSDNQAPTISVKHPYKSAIVGVFICDAGD